MVFHSELSANLHVCPHCQYHRRLTATQRLAILYDNKTFEEIPLPKVQGDPLHFRDVKRYSDRLKDAQQKTNGKTARLSPAAPSMIFWSSRCAWTSRFLAVPWGLRAAKPFYWHHKPPSSLKHPCWLSVPQAVRACRRACCLWCKCPARLLLSIVSNSTPALSDVTHRPNDRGRVGFFCYAG